MKRVVRIVVALCCLVAAGCSPSAAPSGSASPQASRPASPRVANDYNVIMISMNNVGAQHMSLYGYKRSTTPRLDELGKRGLVFEEVYAPNSWTLPGATSLMTSVQPYSHGVMDRMESNQLNPAIPTLAEIFKARGYQTAAFTGGLDYRPTFGHLRGVTDASFNLDFTRFDTSLAQAQRWLSYNGEKKFFLVVQGYDAHPPFRPAAPYKGTFSGGKRDVHVSTRYALRGYKDGDKYVASYIWQESDPDKRRLLEIAYPPEKRTVILTQNDIDYLRDLYDDCVLTVDGEVADFLAHIDPKVMQKTIVVIFSEHGEMFAKHGRFGRAGTVRGNLYDDVVHVPLLILTPSGLKGRVPGLAQLIDIAPTILEMAGIEAPPQFQGRSLMPLVEGKGEVNEYVYAGSQYNIGAKGKAHPFFNESSLNESIRSHKWKLVHEIVYADGTGASPSASTDAASPGAAGRETWELYDLKSDPDESANLAASYSEVAKDLRQRLETWSKAAQEAFKDSPPTTVEFPPDFQEKARRHGYW